MDDVTFKRTKEYLEDMMVLLSTGPINEQGKIRLTTWVLI